MQGGFFEVYEDLAGGDILSATVAQDYVNGLTSKSSSTCSTECIVGAVIGSVVGAAVIIGGAIWCLHKNRI